MFSDLQGGQELRDRPVPAGTRRFTRKEHGRQIATGCLTQSARVYFEEAASQPTDRRDSPRPLTN